jgi:hypothetical protein
MKLLVKLLRSTNQRFTTMIRRDGLASAFVSYREGMSQCFDFNGRSRCVGQRPHDRLTCLRHYTIQEVGMA